MGIKPMYVVTNYEQDPVSGVELPDYVESRTMTTRGFVQLFYLCYPNYARGQMYHAELTEDGAEILNERNELVVKFERIPK